MSFQRTINTILSVHIFNFLFHNTLSCISLKGLGGGGGIIKIRKGEADTHWMRFDNAERFFDFH
jgi:hypothetical protein